MRRRELLIGFCCSLLVFDTAQAQQPPMPVVGFLHSLHPGTFTPLNAVFRRGLAEAGYAEGQNVAIEYRSAAGQPERLAALADELVRRKVAVIVTSTTAAAVAAKRATATIPIVFEMGGDPVNMGLVPSFNRPGGNITGISQFTGTLESKRLELLREAVPAARLIGVLVNPTRPGFATQIADARQAALALGLSVVVLEASDERDLDNVFANFARQRVDALLIGADPLFYSHREKVVTLVARHAVPAIYQWRDHAVIGGLMSYGTSVDDAFRQLGNYTGRVLKGEKPADLPVIQTTKVELVINLKTAKALGVTFPVTLLGRADEVIE